jgi:hypothetical protein
VWTGSVVTAWCRETGSYLGNNNSVGNVDQNPYEEPYPSDISIVGLCNTGKRYDLYDTRSGYDVYVSGGDGTRLGHCSDTSKSVGSCFIPVGLCNYQMYYTCNVPSISC